MTRSDAEQRVIEAARAFVPILKRAEAETRNLLPKGDGYAEAMALVSTVDALSALPPATEPEPVPQLRAVSVAITQPSSETSWAMHVVMSDGSLWEFCGGRWMPFSLPSIPEVVGEVEG